MIDAIGGAKEALREAIAKMMSGKAPPPVDPPSRRPDDGGMDESRFKRLEDFADVTRERLTRIETKLDHMATKEDLHKALSEQTWKVIGAMFTFGALFSGAIYYIAKH